MVLMVHAFWLGVRRFWPLFDPESVPKADFGCLVNTMSTESGLFDVLSGSGFLFRKSGNCWFCTVITAKAVLMCTSYCKERSAPCVRKSGSFALERQLARSLKECERNLTRCPGGSCPVLSDAANRGPDEN